MDPMSTASRTWSEAELLALPQDGFKRELVDGEIRMSAAGAPHGLAIVKLVVAVGTHVEKHGLGFVFSSDTGCWMPSGNLRCPDLTFFSHATLPGGVPDGFLRAVPDLAVEVVSPSETAREIQDKVGEYLDAGVRLVWVIDPVERRAVSWRSLTRARSIDPGGALDGEDVLPGFRCPLAEIVG